MTTPPQPPSETPTPRTDYLIATYMTIASAYRPLLDFARQLEKELQEAKKWKEEDPRMLREQIRVGDEAFNRLTTELAKLKLILNTYRSPDMADDVVAMCNTNEDLKAELALLKRANGEMRRLIEWLLENPACDDELWQSQFVQGASKVLSTSQPSPSIPMDVAEKMYEALNKKPPSIGWSWQEWFDYQFPATEGNLELSNFLEGLQEALSLAEKHGLGKQQ